MILGKSFDKNWETNGRNIGKLGNEWLELSKTEVNQ